MKKILSILALLLTLLSINTFVPSVVLAEDVDPYAWCEDSQIQNMEHYWIIKYHTVTQTFTATYNTLTRAGVTIWGNGDVGQVVTIKIQKVSDNSIVAAGNTTIYADQAQWLEVGYGDIPVVAGQQYKIVVTTPGTHARWLDSHDPNCYAGGAAVVDGITRTQDFGFTVFGHNVAAPANQPAPAAPAPSVPAASPTSAPSAQTQTRSQAVQTIPFVLLKPIITEVKKNNQTVDLAKNEITTLSGTDRITISGTTQVGTTVGVNIGDDNFDTFINDKGEWSTTLDAGVLPRGEFVVRAKAIKDEKESEPVDAVKINVFDVVVKKTEKNNQKLWWYVCGLILIILVTGTAGLTIYIKKKKTNKPT